MKDLKHIDRLFQEKLKDFEATPNDSVWEAIEKELHQKKRKRRVIPIWWQMAGVAAILALLLTVGNFVFDDSSEIKSTNPVVNTDKIDALKGNGINPSTNSNDAVFENNAPNNDIKGSQNSDSKPNSQLKNTATNISIANSEKKSDKALNNNNSNPVGNKSSQITNNVVRIESDTKNEDPNNSTNPTIIDQKKAESEIVTDPLNNNTNTKIADRQNKEDASEIKVENPDNLTNTIEEAIANSNNEDEKEEDKKLSRWNISTNVAPVYFSSLGNGSPLAEQFIDNTKSGNINISYGINGSFALTEKLKIRAGINKVNLGYNTNNVIVYRGVGITLVGALSRSNSNIKFIDDSENTTILSTQHLSFAAVPDIVSTSINSSLNQELGYIELPVEIEYALSSNKFGVNLIGGFSTFFLDNNKVYSTLNGEKSLLGEAKNINDTSYSANFGLGFNYNVSEKIKFNLEPMFKYQINTFRDTSGDFNPFFIGVYTGLSYKF